MNFTNLLLSRKGQIVTIKTIRPLKVRKGVPEILKESEFQCRIGVNYDNIAAVQDKRENGELPAVNAGLPWGSWKVFPYVIEHKGEEFIRCSKVNSGFSKSPVYTQNGKEMDVSDVKRLALASEFYSSDGDVFNIRVSSIVDIKGI